MDEISRVQTLAGLTEGNLKDSVDNLTQGLVNGVFGTRFGSTIEGVSDSLKGRGYKPEVIKAAFSNYLHFLDAHLDDLI